MIDDSAAIKRDKTPIMIVIPGLTSDSSAAVCSFHFFFLSFFLSSHVVLVK